MQKAQKRSMFQLPKVVAELFHTFIISTGAAVETSVV